MGVESRPGEGSTFWFTAVFEKQSNPVQPVSTSPVSLSEIPVLVVDDNATNRLVLSRMLNSFGCRADVASSGVEGIQQLRRAARHHRPYRVVFLDMQMPEMDGEQVARAIKDDPSIAGVQIIILTSMGQRGDSARLAELGCSGVLLKPVKQSQLFQAVLNLIGKNAPTVEAPAGPASSPNNLGCDLADLDILLAEDNFINRKLAITVLKKAGARVDVAENGAQAVDMAMIKPYNVILMDVQMPEMDGLEATRQIRVNEGQKKHTPILAMTAHAMQGDREMCIQSGMDGYVTKPLEQASLFSAILQWSQAEPVSPEELPEGTNGRSLDIDEDWEALQNLSLEEMDLAFLEGLNGNGSPNTNQPAVQAGDRVHQEMDLAQKPPETHSSLEIPSDLLQNEHVCLKEALPRFENDLGFFKEIYTEFVQHMDERIVEIDQAASQKDGDTLRRLAHNLKGVSGNFCTPALTEFARALEACSCQDDFSQAQKCIDSLRAEIPYLQDFMARLQSFTIPNGVEA